MKMRYDPEADALYIRVQEKDIHHTKEIDANTILDFDKDNKIIGVEILFVKERNPGFLKDFHVYA